MLSTFISDETHQAKAQSGKIIKLNSALESFSYKDENADATFYKNVIIIQKGAKYHNVQQAGRYGYWRYMILIFKILEIQLVTNLL